MFRMLRVSSQFPPNNYLRLYPLADDKPALVIVELKQEKSNHLRKFKKNRLYTETERLGAYFYNFSTTLSNLENIQEKSNHPRKLKKYRLYTETEQLGTCCYDFSTTLPDVESVFNFMCLYYSKLYPGIKVEQYSRRRSNPTEKPIVLPPLADLFKDASPFIIITAPVEAPTAQVEVLPDSSPQEQLGADRAPSTTTSETPSSQGLNPTSKRNEEPIARAVVSPSDGPRSSLPLSEEPPTEAGPPVTPGDEEQPPPPPPMKNPAELKLDPNLITVEKFDEIISEYVSSSKFLARFFNPYRSETIRNLRKLTSFNVSLVMLDKGASDIKAGMAKCSISLDKPVLIRFNDKIYLYTEKDKEPIQIPVELSVIKKLPFSANAVVNYTSAQFPPALAQWFSKNKISYCKQGSVTKDLIKDQIKSEHRLKIFGGSSEKIKLRNNTDKRIDELNKYFKSVG